MMETGLNLLSFSDEFTHSRFQWPGTFFCACQSMHARLLRFHTALAALQIFKLFVRFSTERIRRRRNIQTPLPDSRTLIVNNSICE